MDNFDNLDPIDDFFKGSLRAAGQGEKPGAGEWEWLASKLDQAAPKPSPNRFIWGAICLLLLFSLAANTWFFSKWRDTGNEVGLLKTEFLDLKSRFAESAQGAKKHEQITLFDTVYRTAVIRKTVFWDEKMQDPTLAFSKTNLIGALPGKGSVATDFIVADKNDGISAAEKPADLAENTDAVSPKIAALNFSFLTENGFADFLVDSLNQLLDENRQEDALDRARADSLNVAVKTLAGRFDSLMNLRSQPIVAQRCPRPVFRLGGGLSTLTVFSMPGLKIDPSAGLFVGGEAQFGWHFTVGAAVGYANFKFEQSGKYDPRLLIPAPVSPGSEYEFYHIEGRQHIFLPEITAGYRFFPSKKWSPRLTAGWGWRFFKTGNTEYEFKNKLTGDEAEVSVAQPGWQGRGQQLSLRAGIERRLTGRFLAFGDAGAVFDFGPGQRGAQIGLARLGLAVGL